MHGSNRLLLSVLLVIGSANLQGLAKDQAVSPPKSKSETDAEVAYRRGMTTKTPLKYYNEAIRLNPKFVDAYLARSCYYDRIKEPKLQKADLDRAIELAPANLRAVLGRASYYANLHNWSQALSEYTKSIEISPQNWYGYEERAKVYRHLNRLDLAEKDEHKARSLFRPEPDKIPDTKHLSKEQAGRELGRYYMRHKQFAQALKEFSRCASPHDPYQETYTSRGECYEQLGDYNSALKDYTKYLELFPNEINGYRLRAKLYEKMNRQDLAKKDLETRDAISSGRLRYPYPISYYTGLIKDRPNDRSLFLSRGIRLKEKHQYHEAISDLTKALSMNPEDSHRSNFNLDQIYYERANCYESIGDYPHAIADYNSILKMDEDAEEAFLYRGNCNAKMGHWEKAVRDYTECIKQNIEPTPMPFIARAKAYEKLGKTELAKRDYQRAKELQ